MFKLPAAGNNGPNEEWGKHRCSQIQGWIQGESMQAVTGPWKTGNQECCWLLSI